MKRGEKDEYSLACVVSKGAKQYGKDPQIDSCLNGNTEYCNLKNQFKKKKHTSPRSSLRVATGHFEEY